MSVSWNAGAFAKKCESCVEISLQTARVAEMFQRQFHSTDRVTHGNNLPRLQVIVMMAQVIDEELQHVTARCPLDRLL